jgi:hypothetical protein
MISGTISQTYRLVQKKDQKNENNFATDGQGQISL